MTLRAVWELERECMCVCVKLFDFVFRKRSKWSTQESSSCTIWKPNTYLPWFVCIIIPKLVNSNSPYADQVCLNSSFNLCFFLYSKRALNALNAMFTIDFWFKISVTENVREKKSKTNRRFAYQSKRIVFRKYLVTFPRQFLLYKIHKTIPKFSEFTIKKW